MSWSITSFPQMPESIEAKYFFYLPNDAEVVWAHVLNLYSAPRRHYGGLDTFISAQRNGTPLIPIDIHLVMSLGWVDEHVMARNMPWASEKVRAAIALVT